MRASSSRSALVSSVALLALATSQRVGAVTFQSPTLYQCEPAVFNVSATGNFTIEGRDAATRKLVFRSREDENVTQVTWSAVDLAAGSSAIIEVTDQIGKRRSQTESINATSIILDSPTGNKTCLETHKKSSSASKTRSAIPAIVGASLGGFVFLMILLVGFMMYRRRKERGLEKFDNNETNDWHSNGQAPQPGQGYMAKLVPGLNLGEARPLPRDPVLESQQAEYALSVRNSRHFTRPKHHPRVNSRGDHDIDNQLPSYNQSQRQSRAAAQQLQRARSDPRYPPAVSASQVQPSGYADDSFNNPTNDYSWSDSREYPHPNDPFQQPQHEVNTSAPYQNDWDRSQTSFLRHNGQGR